MHRKKVRTGFPLSADSIAGEVAAKSEVSAPLGVLRMHSLPPHAHDCLVCAADCLACAADCLTCAHACLICAAKSEVSAPLGVLRMHSLPPHILSSRCVA